MIKDRLFSRKAWIVCLTILMVAAVVLAGCKSSSGGGGGGSGSSGSSGSNDYSEHLTITVFSNAANYQGEQTGWYGKLLKDKFNITLNILAPQVAGSQLYNTRVAGGDLGDILVIDNSQLEELIPAGMVLDLTDMIQNTKHLSQYVEKHFKPFNSSFTEVNPEGRIYAMPTFIAPTSPTTFSEELPYSSPILPWDYYQGIGAPKITDLDHLLEVLKTMRDQYPKAPNGLPTIPITLWKDWDGGSMENVRWISNWYGYEHPEGTTTIQLSASGDIMPLIDDRSNYKKVLQFLFKANQMGLVDPDSAAQDWNKVAEKLTNKQVLLLWYTWQRGFYNTIARGMNGDGYAAVPIADVHILQTSDAYYGNGRVFAIGSKAKNPQRIMDFLDWYVSPEGLRYTINGFEGFNYERTEDGKFRLTEIGQTAFQDNTPVPDEYGGGGYQDGQYKINSLIIGDFGTDPETGEFYNSNYWSHTLAANDTKLRQEWQQMFGTTNATEYYIKNNMIDIVPNINTSLGSDSSDIKNKRSQISDYVKDASWKMVFAKDQAEFDQLWSKMQTDVKGLGWDDVFAVDSERAQKIIRLRAEALANQ